MVLDATLPPVGVQPVVDVTARYREAHIPGALRFDLEALSDQQTTLPHMLPSPRQFAAEMGRLGVSSHMTAVVYEQEGMFAAPRAWWTLRTMGMPQVFLLDGGLPAWLAAGLPVEAGEPTRPAALFTATLDELAVRSFPQMQQHLAAAGQVLDARSAGRFQGSAPEPRPGIRSGHMPGATSLPYTEVLREGRLLDKPELVRLFAERGVDLDRPVVTTCGSGITAAVLTLALQRAGARKVSLYDGSWAEYAQHPEAQLLP